MAKRLERFVAEDYPGMSLEIERKFLVANEGWKTAVLRSVRIRDGLIANNKGHKARVRIANDIATIALKSRRRGPVRTEFESGEKFASLRFWPEPRL